MTQHYQHQNKTDIMGEWSKIKSHSILLRMCGDLVHIDNFRAKVDILSNLSGFSVRTVLKYVVNYAFLVIRPRNLQ